MAIMAGFGLLYGFGPGQQILADDSLPIELTKVELDLLILSPGKLLTGIIGPYVGVVQLRYVDGRPGGQ